MKMLIAALTAGLMTAGAASAFQAPEEAVARGYFDGSNLALDVQGIEGTTGNAVTVKAGDFLNPRELTESGLSANDTLTVSEFSYSGPKGYDSPR